MKYVLDVAVALSWVIPRPHSPKAIRLRDEYRRAIHDLIAPSIFSAEAASALTKSERQKLIPVGHGRILLADILTTPPVVHLYDPQRKANSSRNQAR
jgi:hypothetical protein